MSLNFGQLKTLARSRVPPAVVSLIDNTLLEKILNDGAEEVAFRTGCLPTNKKFNVVAEQSDYLFSNIDEYFLCIKKAGLLWYDGTSWVDLIRITAEWLDENYGSWRSATSSDPQYYYIEGDRIVVYPKPDTSGTNYFWIHYNKKPTAMTDDSHYPFGNSVIIPQLTPLHKAIIHYFEWQAKTIAAEPAENVKEAMVSFYAQVDSIWAKISETDEDIFNEETYMKVEDYGYSEGF